MSASGYTPWSVTVGEQPTTAYWNILGTNDSSFNTGEGFNDQIITWRHLDTSLIPTGTIHAYAGSTAPSTGWLLCDGSAVSRSDYAALFSVCGTMYGSGDGSTTFNLPNAAGHVLVGLSAGNAHFSAIGVTGGETDHTLTWNEMPVHNHGVNDPGHNHGISWVGTFVNGYGWLDSFHSRSSGYAYTSWNGSNISIQNAGSGWAHNNLQPYVVVNYIIKT